MERSFGQAMGQGPIYSEFGRDVQANFGQQDGLSYYGIPRQIGPQSRPLIQGVDALFQDYRGGSQGPLEFDFNDDLLPEDGVLNPQQAIWQRQAVFSNLAAQGAAIQTVTSQDPQYLGSNQQSQTGPWDSWNAGENQRMDMENSSADSFPKSSFKMEPSRHSPGPGQADLEMENFPKMEVPPRSAKPSARQTAQQERDRERAEKLKEKNKRAQRKFRQRQKDRQETAEKMASDLAEELKALQIQKDALEQRNQQLEAALQQSNDKQMATPVEAPQISNEEGNPTFMPAKGWSEFNPRGGMVLVAICQPPRRLTHNQIMSLSLRDVSKIMNELVLRLRNCLAAVDNPATASTAEARIQALLSERHAIMAYMAVNEPKTVYKILSTKMTDPPEPDCHDAPPNLWSRVLSSMQMSDTQKANMMEARVAYIKKIGELLLERQELRVRLQNMDLIPAPSDITRIPTLHLAWNEAAERLKDNIDMSHRCHAYFMSRLWYHDCFTPLQVSRFIVEAHPYPIDVFSIIRLVAAQVGERSYMEILENSCGKEEVEKARIPLDSYVENWPQNLVGRDQMGAYRMGSDASDKTATSSPPHFQSDLSTSLPSLPSENSKSSSKKGRPSF